MKKEYNPLDEIFIKETENGEKKLTKEGIKIIVLISILSPIIILITKIKYKFLTRKTKYKQLV